MYPITSPLVEHARLHAVHVCTSSEWETFGRQAWGDMMNALAATPVTRRVMGIDSEWFRKNPLATVQVATATHCFVIHLSYLSGRLLPFEVRTAFEDDTIIKCGVGVSGDVKRLQAEQHLQMRCVMDLGNYATMMGLSQNGKTNLAALAQSACEVTMRKDHMITRSNWELPLSEAQFAYAADDAVASFLIGDRIMQEAIDRFSLDDRTFKAVVWLAQTQQQAASSLKTLLREKQQATTEARQQGRAAREEGNGPAAPQNAIRVRVLDKDGNYLFDCSSGRVKYYVEEKGIATVTKFRPHSQKPLEIKLNFVNQTNTRLCMYHAVGQCELGEHCPFAHGVEQLCEDSQRLLTDPAAFSCGFCLAQKNLMRHAIVPPSFRKFLPKPIRFPVDTEDFVPICTQCNTFIRHYYDFFMKQIYQEAEDADPNGKVAMDLVAKSVSYARLLLNERKLKSVPARRQAQLKEFVLAHWAATRMFDPQDDDPTVTVSTEDASPPEADTHETTKEQDHGKCKEGAAAVFSDDWESLEDDDAAATCEAGEHPPHEGDATAAPTMFMDRNGTKVPVRLAETGEVNPDFLERLSHVVPGEVRARVTMENLVGNDKEKALEFVERCRAFCQVNCGMVEKPSNHLTSAQWEALTQACSKSTGRHAREQTRNGRETE